MSNIIDTDLLTSKIKKSLDLLRSTYRSKDGKGGWYHYLDSENPGPTASAVGLMTFKLAKVHFEHSNEVLAFLKSKQIHSSDPRKNGGWAISVLPEQPTLEASGWVIKGLGEIRPYMSPDSPDIFSAYNWLVANKNDDHGWGSFYGQPSRTYLTCMALRAIAAIDPFSETLLLGQKWLLENINKNLPVWGATVSSPPTILHTAFVLITIAELNLGFDRKTTGDAIEWLTRELKPDTLVEAESLVEDYDISYETGNNKSKYQNSLPHYALPVAISALLHHENSLNKNVVYEGLLNIANAQHSNGYWENARNPTRISIWAIWPFLNTLFDAIDLPVLAQAKSVTKISSSIIIKTSKARTPLIFLLVVDFFILSFEFLKAYWSAFVLLGFVLLGLLLTTLGFIGLKEYILSLIFPVILIFVQLSLERRQLKK